MRLCSCGAECPDDAPTCAACGAALASGDDSGALYATGEVFGSYRLIEQIGEGGMGRVFVAEHVRLGRRVALKMLRPEFSNHAEAVKRFFAEARAVNRIKHENIIEVTDFIESTRGRSFYIMELLNGIDLRMLQDRDGALPIGRALGIAIQICRGLGAAHDAGIVHRDLKPDNVFLAERRDGRDLVKLVDFGVAKLMDDAADDASRFRTSAGMVVGTPEYMSPEQAAGDPADHRSDVYALGVILFEMITGRRPFEAASAREIMAQHVTMPPPRPSKVLRFAGAMPAALEELILHCLQKEPDERPQTMMRVEQRLDEIARRLSVPVITPPSADRASPRGPGRRWLWVAGFAGVAMGLLVAKQLVQPRTDDFRAGARSPPAGAQGAVQRPEIRLAIVPDRSPDRLPDRSPDRLPDQPRPARAPAPAASPAAPASAAAPAADGVSAVLEVRTTGATAKLRSRPARTGATKTAAGKLDHSTVLDPFE